MRWVAVRDVDEPGGPPNRRAVHRLQIQPLCAPVARLERCRAFGRESSRVIGGMHEGRLAPEAQNQWGGIPLSSDHSNDFNRLASY